MKATFICLCLALISACLGEQMSVGLKRVPFVPPTKRKGAKVINTLTQPMHNGGHYEPLENYFDAQVR